MAAPRATSAHPVLKRLDRLRIKLFLAIAGANAVLALLAYLVVSWSFDRGLVDYLNRADEARLTPLIERLAENYRSHGDWGWLLQDRERWPQLVFETLGVGRWRRDMLQRPGPHGPAHDSDSQTALPPLPPGRLLTMDPRLMLFDADGQLLAGHPRLAREAILRPIRVDGRVVGQLGYVPRLNRVESLEKLFAAQQNRRFAAIAVGLLLAGVLVSALLAHWLTRRIRRLGQVAASLIQGDYSARITVDGYDELAQLGEDFNRLGAALEAARESRQQWIADIAHELRTPLSVLRGEIEAMQDGVRPLTPASLSSLAQEVARLTRLVDDLNLLSLSDLGALSYRRQRLVLADSLVAALQSQRHLLQEKGLIVEQAFDAQLTVFADAERIAQVIGNLLQNTLRYTDAPGRLQVELRRDGAWAELVWQDSSPGVPDAALPRLTERLFRVDVSRSRQGGGSGLGLSITRAIIAAHGGSMTASHSPLGGLRWSIRLPLADGATRSRGAADE